jgi:hypothetical protein
MKTLFIVFVLHFFLGAMLFVTMGSKDSRKGLSEASEIMVRSSIYR